MIKQLQLTLEQYNGERRTFMNKTVKSISTLSKHSTGGPKQFLSASPQKFQQSRDINIS